MSAPSARQLEASGRPVLGRLVCTRTRRRRLPRRAPSRRARPDDRALHQPTHPLPPLAPRRRQPARIDGFVSLGVLASAGAVALGVQVADLIIGLLTTIVILRSRGRIGTRFATPRSTSSTSKALMDRPHPGSAVASTGMVRLARPALRLVVAPAAVAAFAGFEFRSAGAVAALAGGWCVFAICIFAIGMWGNLRFERS